MGRNSSQVLGRMARLRVADLLQAFAALENTVVGLRSADAFQGIFPIIGNDCSGLVVIADRIFRAHHQVLMPECLCSQRCNSAAPRPGSGHNGKKRVSCVSVPGRAPDTHDTRFFGMQAPLLIFGLFTPGDA